MDKNTSPHRLKGQIMDKNTTPPRLKGQAMYIVQFTLDFDVSIKIEKNMDISYIHV